MTRRILSIAIAAALLSLPMAAPASASAEGIQYRTPMGNDCCY
jgi:hypothetical protein